MLARTMTTFDPPPETAPLQVVSPPPASAEALAALQHSKPEQLTGWAAVHALLANPKAPMRWARRLFALALETPGGLKFDNVSAPADVWASFVKQISGKMYFTHIGVSIRRIAIAYLFACAIGIPIGLLMGRSRIINDFVMPYVEILRPIPAVAWIPLAILMWPTEESSILYITFLGALFPVILNTVAGVEQTPEVLVRAARSLGAKEGQIFRHVVLPAALPNIATGLAVGMGVAWFSLLAGEIISGQYGIGYFTWTAYHLIKYPDIIVGMLSIGFLGTLSTLAVKFATSPFLRWQARTR